MYDRNVKRKSSLNVLAQGDLLVAFYGWVRRFTNI